MSDSHSPNRIAVVRMRLIEIVTETNADYARVAPRDGNGASVLVPLESIVAIEPRGAEADSGRGQ